MTNQTINELDNVIVAIRKFCSDVAIEFPQFKKQADEVELTVGNLRLELADEL